MKSRTPDERLLAQLYKLAQQSGDLPIDSRLAARAASLKETAAKNIIKHLAQANFVKKVSDTHLHLTPHGHKFVEEHLA
ncbi:MAG TPA: hypothetical protein VLE89_03265 [Chlamydiales bacterium]|nr:hypothetical protein [Chlamydiales bacterium]